jgi:DNA-binding cell septation regulator SpoVG
MSSLKECEVVSVHRLEGDGNLKAFLDIRIGGGLLIRGCTVMEGRKGTFASLPRRLGRDGRWTDVVVPSDDLRVRYEEVMLQAYQEAADAPASR